VTSPDFRLQRPEFLGGGTARININQVEANTSAGNYVVGDLSGFGFAMDGGKGFVKSFTEHCVLIGLVNARADITYQQGVNRMWNRQTRYDYYWPSLAHLGEQAVLNQEIYAQGSAGGSDDTDVFGYQERYSEYRYKPSYTANNLMSTAGAPADAWHLALEFGSLPLLNDVFIEDAPPISRVLAISSSSIAADFIGDFYFDLKCARPMPMFSVPGLIDHF